MASRFFFWKICATLVYDSKNTRIDILYLSVNYFCSYFGGENHTMSKAGNLSSSVFTDSPSRLVSAIDRDLSDVAAYDKIKMEHFAYTAVLCTPLLCEYIIFIFYTS